MKQTAADAVSEAQRKLSAANRGKKSRYSGTITHDEATTFDPATHKIRKAHSKSARGGKRG